MPRHLALVLIMLSLLTAASPSWAYGEGGSYGGTGLSNATTNKIARTLTRGAAACQRLDKVYRYDCYRQTYQQAAQQMNGMRAYAGAQAIINEVTQSLERTIARNADPAAPRVRKGLQTYRAIQPAALPRAKADFITALEKAETRLLRSPEDSRAHYARIAEAINTNKVLLRSALMLLPAPLRAAALFWRRDQADSAASISATSAITSACAGPLGASSAARPCPSVSA